MLAALAALFSCALRLRSAALSYGSGVLCLEPPAGFEPATLGLRYRCSTAELWWLIVALMQKTDYPTELFLFFSPRKRGVALSYGGLNMVLQQKRTVGRALLWVFRLLEARDFHGLSI